MPRSSDNKQFLLPHINDTRVGQKVFYIEESFLDGTPKLRQTLRTRASIVHGLREWRFDQPFDPNRPGDIIPRESILRNLEKLWAMDWETACEEARTACQQALDEKGWHEIPVQTHLIGEKVPSTDGNEVEVEHVELIDADFIGLDMAKSPVLIYADQHRQNIQIAQ